MIRSWPYVFLALCFAASAAGVLVGLEFAAFGWLAGVIEGKASEGVIAYGVLAAIIATPVFLVGLVFPGVPVWLWLHGLGHRSYASSALAVAIGASIAGAVLTAQAAGWWALMCVAWLRLPGAVAGLVLRWTAYTRPKPPRPSPAPPS